MIGILEPIAKAMEDLDVEVGARIVEMKFFSCERESAAKSRRAVVETRGVPFWTNDLLQLSSWTFRLSLLVYGLVSPLYLSSTQHGDSTTADAAYTNGVNVFLMVELFQSPDNGLIKFASSTSVGSSNERWKETSS
jgi:hypothetical protein